MGDNLKQHNPNFIVLQSGMGAWLRVIGSNLCTSVRLNKKKDSCKTTASSISLRAPNPWLRWFQLPNWAFTAGTFKNLGSILMRQYCQLPAP